MKLYVRLPVYDTLDFPLTAKYITWNVYAYVCIYLYSDYIHEILPLYTYIQAQYSIGIGCLYEIWHALYEILWPVFLSLHLITSALYMYPFCFLFRCIGHPVFDGSFLWLFMYVWICMSASKFCSKILPLIHMASRLSWWVYMLSSRCLCVCVRVWQDICVCWHLGWGEFLGVFFFCMYELTIWPHRILSCF